MRHGTITRYLANHNYGFICQDDPGPEVYFRAVDLCEPLQLELVAAGVRVTYRDPVSNTRGLATYHVFVVNE